METFVKEIHYNECLSTKDPLVYRQAIGPRYYRVCHDLLRLCHLPPSYQRAQPELKPLFYSLYVQPIQYLYSVINNNLLWRRRKSQQGQRQG